MENKNKVLLSFLQGETIRDKNGIYKRQRLKEGIVEYFSVNKWKASRKNLQEFLEWGFLDEETDWEVYTQLLRVRVESYEGDYIDNFLVEADLDEIRKMLNGKD